MGTTYHITVVFEGEQPEAAQLQDGIDALLGEINGQMSTYIPDSELSQFNASPANQAFDVSPETALVVERALQIALQSNGVYDPTVGPLVRLWGFGGANPLSTIPSDDQIESTRQRVSWKYIEVSQSPPTLKKSRVDVELDLSSIAKGYAVDVVHNWLIEQPQLTGHLVEIGGEVRTRSTKPDGSLWRLAIEVPDRDSREGGYVVDLNNESLATSGDYRNFVEINGQFFSHTINPQTGRPVEHTLGSVSVLAEDCMTADALATTLNVLGPELGLQFAEDNHIAAFFVVRNDDTYQEFASTTAQGRITNLSEKPAAPEEIAASPLFTVLVTIAAFALAMLGLALGYLIKNRLLKGTCGGLQNFHGQDGKSACELCAKPREECQEFRDRLAQMAAESEDNSEPEQSDEPGA
ncbi:MAG: FAD:protein FMN transferase [Planctomycetaceae bacterium]|nr:FAD:protein FMN transferase [Planctomycetaceae bacterium]